MLLSMEKHGCAQQVLGAGDIMDSCLGRGIASLGVAASVIYGLYITHDVNCFWGFLALIFIWDIHVFENSYR